MTDNQTDNQTSDQTGNQTADQTSDQTADQAADDNDADIEGAPTQTARAVAPRFNHVAMSVPADLLGEDGRAEVLAFYGEVFGWQELPTETIDRGRLVMMAHRYDQFVFLIADDEPMRTPRLDHFGQSVGTLDDLVTLRDRTVAFRERTGDDRVDLIDITVEDHPGLRLHNFYVGYLLPMMVETQFFDWT